MIREFTETVGRFSKGQRFDYPRATWDRIAVESGKPLEAFSSEIDTARGSSWQTRIFTKAVGRYQKGQKAAYPPDVWSKMAAETNQKLEAFTALEN